MSNNLHAFPFKFKHSTKYYNIKTSEGRQLGTGREVTQGAGSEPPGGRRPPADRDGVVEESLGVGGEHEMGHGRPARRLTKYRHLRHR